MAGTITRYCLLPIRTVRTKGDVHIDIKIEDKWE
nr:MAG TPA: hypothetical protein [Caudoviricetes sp.]